MHIFLVTIHYYAEDMNGEMGGPFKDQSNVQASDDVKARKAALVDFKFDHTGERTALLFCEISHVCRIDAVTK